MKETLLTKLQREAREYFMTDNHTSVDAEKLNTLIANTLKQAAEALEGMKHICTEECYCCGHPPCEYEMGHTDALTDAQKVLLGEDNGNL